jgi:hypothetical protein
MVLDQQRLATRSLNETVEQFCSVVDDLVIVCVVGGSPGRYVAEFLFSPSTETQAGAS